MIMFVCVCVLKKDFFSFLFFFTLFFFSFCFLCSSFFDLYVKNYNIYPYISPISAFFSILTLFF